ncbi:MAG: CsbD family protein [Actinomycetota bacterium]|nr:CsbD family protein [Actinomycetota bacterium]
MGINADQAKGRAKQAAGDITGNEDLKKQGKADEKAGDVKKFIHDVGEKADELVDKVKDAVHKD